MLQQVFGFARLVPHFAGLAPILEGLVPPLGEPGRSGQRLARLSLLPGLLSPRLRRPSQDFPLLGQSRVPRAPPRTTSRTPKPASSRKNLSPFRSTGSVSRSARPYNDATPASPRTRALLQNTHKT